MLDGSSGSLTLLPVVRPPLHELGVVEGSGLLWNTSAPDAVGGVAHVEGPYVQDAEILVLVAFIHIGVPRPLLGNGLVNRTLHFPLLTVGFSLHMCIVYHGS